MTRINSNINPKFLTDQHLQAEHREIKRMCKMFEERYYINKFDDIPKKFTLNNGHMKFFLDKGQFTFRRYKALHKECLNRRMNVTDFSDNWEFYWYRSEYFKNWESTINDDEIVISRIRDRIMKSKQKPRYYRETISKIDACDLLSGQYEIMKNKLYEIR